MQGFFCFLFLLTSARIKKGIDKQTYPLVVIFSFHKNLN